MKEVTFTKEQFEQLYAFINKSVYTEQGRPLLNYLDSVVASQSKTEPAQELVTKTKK